MKIREFFDVAGFDPEVCESGSFTTIKETAPFNTYVRAPCCPIAHAAALWGANIDNEIITARVQNNCHISLHVLSAFVGRYDSAFSYPSGKNNMFNEALEYAEEVEKIEAEIKESNNNA